MGLKIVCEKQRIFSSSNESENRSRDRISVYYFEKLDRIVLIADEMLLKYLEVIAETYLALSDRGRKECMEHCDDSRVGKTILGIEQALNRIIRIRRRLFRTRELKGEIS